LILDDTLHFRDLLDHQPLSLLRFSSLMVQ
jgi:hypothetical protein